MVLRLGVTAAVYAIYMNTCRDTVAALTPALRPALTLALTPAPALTLTLTQCHRHQPLADHEWPKEL